MTAADDVLQHVGRVWSDAREIHDRIGCWGFTTVRHALNHAAEAGLIEARYQPHPNGTVTEYRKKLSSQDGNHDAKR